MVFELGKYYKSSGGGRKLHIIALVDTAIYGDGVLLAEEPGYGNFVPVGGDESHTINWSEIDKEEYFGQGEKIANKINKKLIEPIENRFEILDL